jgi:RNA polymerase sigma-70 factor (ECF subfamily)
MTTDFKTEMVALLPRLRRYARARTGSPDEADELVQATCERAWKARHQWMPGTQLDCWMFTIMHNTRIDQIRAATVRGPAEDPEVLDAVPDHTWSRRIEASVALEQVARAMQQLPEAMREVIALVAIEGLSYKEAAAVLDIPIGTVMSRLARGRTELMQRMGLDFDTRSGAPA